MVVNSTGDYTAVAELMATANKVNSDFIITYAYLCMFRSFSFFALCSIQVDPKVVEERFSDRLQVICFGRMENINATEMQNKSNEYNAFISQEEKPLEFSVKEMGGYIRRWIVQILL